MTSNVYTSYYAPTAKIQHITHPPPSQTLHHHQFSLITQTAGNQSTNFTTSQNSSSSSSMAPPTPIDTHGNHRTTSDNGNNNSQFTSNQQQTSMIPSPLDSHQTSATQCNATTTTVTSIASSIASPISSLPTPPNIPANLTTNPNSNPAAVLSSNFDLQEILSQFGAQTDLLKLILTSKVEEDKRRTEEAKLRNRELDLLLMERYRQRGFEDIHNNSLGAYLSPDGSLTYAFTSPMTVDASSTTNNNNQKVRVKLSTKGESTSQDQLTSQNVLNSNNNNNTNSNNDDTEDCGMNVTPNKRKRKRREMLAVTMIIETKENPYKDDYLWKNNGNTIQRKTGNKSVYYKCSNSNKGCPVNKTVTEKEDGWMIKYRGHHLEDCGKIKRIIQS